MNQFKMIKDYKYNDKYRLSFNELAKETFNIDFEKWYQLGLWNDNYICYSYLDGDQVIANVSVNKMKLILYGETKSALQIGTVMTHPDYRKRGLATSLMRTVFAEFEDSYNIIFLFPEDNAINFYQQFGFTSFTEGKFILENLKTIQSLSKLRKLNPENNTDLDLLVKFATERIPTSQMFGTAEAHHVLNWYCVGLLKDYIYYLEEDNLIILFKHVNGTLHVFDIISKEVVSFYQVLSKLGIDKIQKVVFHFTPDFLDVKIDEMSFKPEELMFFKPKTLKLDGHLSYPMTSHA